MSRVALCLISYAVTVALGAPTAGERRITTASNVRVRSAPSAKATIVTELPVGSEVSSLEGTESSRRWVHVRTADDREGWMASRLSRPFDETRRAETIESILRQRGSPPPP